MGSSHKNNAAPEGRNIVASFQMFRRSAAVVNYCLLPMAYAMGYRSVAALRLTQKEIQVEFVRPGETGQFIKRLTPLCQKPDRQGGQRRQASPCLRAGF
jgi:hypothetical protein